MPAVSATSLPVRLSPDGWFRYDLVGELCSVGNPDGKVLQVLVSGAGYGADLLGLPLPAGHLFLHARRLRAGYATFNFYRLGMGESDHPPGLLLNVDNQAYVLGQIITALRTAHDFSAVVTVGHSFGSVIAIAHALSHPRQVAGIVLTGFAHNTNPGFIAAMRAGVDLAAFKGPFAGRIVDPTYLVSKADTRGDTFYTRGQCRSPGNRDRRSQPADYGHRGGHLCQQVLWPPVPGPAGARIPVARRGRFRRVRGTWTAGTTP